MWLSLHKQTEFLSSKLNGIVQNISKIIFFANKLEIKSSFNTTVIIVVFVKG